ncbi:MAG: tetratricopeptide repeat protein [Thermoanaerobaculia bacterium]
MRPFPFVEPVQRVLPAAALLAWDPSGSGAIERLTAAAARTAGVIPAGPGCWLLLPVPGDPAIFDRAVALAGDLVRDDSGGKRPVTARLVVVPAAARVGPGVELVAEPLLEELRATRPDLAPGKILLTTHAALQLEGSHSVEAAGNLSLGAGRLIPLTSVRPRAVAIPTWRNPEVLSRSIKWVGRPVIEADLRRRLKEPVLRLEGPFGVGKTRLLWEVLRGAGEAAIWRDAGSRILTPIARELAGEPLRPIRVVYDHLDVAPPTVWAEIEELGKHPGLGSELQIVLVSRTPIDVLRDLSGDAPLFVDAPDEAAWGQLTTQLFRGLSLPEPVAQELASGVARNPFALEESLLFLVRDRKLRQVFGSFFFSGAEGPTRLQPSRRFIAHVEAEAMRHGASLALRLLTLAETAVPASELGSAALALGGERPEGDWSAGNLAAGLVVADAGPWGDGIALASPAIRRALADTLEEPVRERLRSELGELLAARSSTAEELWASYGMLKGTESGAGVLIDAVRSSSRLPREPLFTALRLELASLQERGNEPRLENDLLWILLPLARRLGRLHELAPALERGFELARDQPQRFLAIASLRADLAQMAGHYPEAEAVLRQALAASRDGDNRRKEMLLVELGRVLVRQGKTAEASDLFAKALAVAEHRGRRGFAATCRFLLGNVAFHEFRLEEAHALHIETLEARRREGGGGVAASLTALGAVALARGDAPSALAYFEEARELLANDRSEAEEAFALVGVGRAMNRLGDVAGAAPVLRRALALREGRDDTMGEAIARLAVAENLLLLDQPDNALAEARKAHFSLSLLPAGEPLADANQLLGRIQSRLRRYEAALAHFDEAADLHEALGKSAGRLTDLAHRIEAEIGRARAEGVRTTYEQLQREMERLPLAPSRELLDFQLYLAAEWLETKFKERLAPVKHLEKAFDELMRLTAFLESSKRQRFLFQVPLNRAIMEAATRKDLSLPSI